MEENNKIMINYTKYPLNRNRMKIFLGDPTSEEEIINNDGEEEKKDEKEDDDGNISD